MGSTPYSDNYGSGFNNPIFVSGTQGLDYGSGSSLLGYDRGLGSYDRGLGSYAGIGVGGAALGGLAGYELADGDFGLDGFNNDFDGASYGGVDGFGPESCKSVSFVCHEVNFLSVGYESIPFPLSLYTES